MVTIQCLNNKKHFQNIAKVKSNVQSYIDAMMKIQDKCHICDAKLEIVS